MNAELEKFIKVYLGLEEAYDTSGYLRKTLHAFKNSYVSNVREGLFLVLASRELSTGDYEGVTGIEFESDDAMYAYLQAMHDYLFEGAEKQPEPPE